AEAVREIRPTALLFAPTGESSPAGFDRYSTGHTPPLHGRRYRRRGRRLGNLPRRSPIIASSEGITYLRNAPERPLTVRFRDVAAVLELGPGRVTIIAKNGDSISRLDTKALLKGRGLEREIEENVPRELLVPL